MSDEPKAIAEILDHSKPEQPRDEHGKFASKQAEPAEPAKEPEPTGVKPPEPPAAPPAAEPSQQPPQGHVPLAALVDQRLEARQAKQERDQLRRQLQDLQKAKEQPPVDFYADPDGALNQRLAPLQQQLEQTVSTLTLRASKAEAVANHGRQAVVDMEKAVGEAMESGDPGVMALRASMLQSDDPVGVAMDWFQSKRVMAEVGHDPVAYREKLKAEIRAEMQGNGGQETPQQPAPVMPSNLAGARNVGNRTGPPWAGPKPLNDIFKR